MLRLLCNKANIFKTKIPTRRLQQAIVETQVKVRNFYIGKPVLYILHQLLVISYRMLS